jgi:hypothetical protein
MSSACKPEQSRNRDRLPHPPRRRDYGLCREGGHIEVAQRMVGHSDTKISGLRHRSKDPLSGGEVERVGI